MTDLPASVLEAAQVVWDYHHMGQRLVASDVIFVLGSHDLRVADRAVDLFEEGWAPLILMSGGYGNFTEGHFTEPEADLFASLAFDRGVPRDRVLIENKSTNTGENVCLSRQLLVDRGIQVRTAIAVQKPYMERRTFATIRKQWPELSFTVTSPQLSLSEYCTDAIPLEQVITIMVGDLNRILTYPARGFQIPQEVPAKVMQAFEYLRENSFDGHMG